MDTILCDVRAGLRALRASYGLTAAAVLALAVGIGAATSVFTVVNGALLRPLPYPEPERLVSITSALPGSGLDRLGLTEPEYLALRDETGFFAGLALYRGFSANLSGVDEAAWIGGALVSPGLIEVLGARPTLGRVFTEQEALHRVRVAMLSHGAWTRRFAADPEVLGRAVDLNGTRCTIIGVLPPGLVAPSDLGSTDSAEVWLPFTVDPADLNWGSHTLEVVARLAPGVAPAAALSKVEAVVARLAAARPEVYPADQRATMYVEPLRDRFVAPVRPALRLLVAAVAMVLLIACSNVANLLLARGTAREREMGIRSAIGAGRLRIVRQLLIESLLLALAGGAAGLLISWWSFDLIVSLAPADVAPIVAQGFDGRVFLFALASSALTAVLFGLGPALRASRAGLDAALREGSKGLSAGPRRQAAREALVVGEVALATLLVVGSGLLLRSFVGLLGLAPGFDPEGVLSGRIALLPPSYQDERQISAVVSDVLARIRSLPAVESAAAVTTLPLAGFGGDSVFDLEGKPAAQEDPASYGPVYPHAGYRPVTAGYFRTLGIPLFEGRVLEARDGVDAPLVAVVNHTFAERFFPDESAVGKRLRLYWTVDTRGPWATIVGVVGDSRIKSLGEEAKQEIFLPLPQLKALAGWTPRGVTLLVKAQGPAAAVAGATRAAVHEIDPALPLYRVRSMDQVVMGTLSAQRFSLVLLGLFAGVALLLAAVGIYCLLAYTVTQRRREIGVRIALGARPPEVLRKVLGAGVRLTLLGLALGLAGATALTRLLAGQLHDVSPTDPATFTGVALVLLAVALLASYLPARRAMRLDPMVTLRGE